MISSIWDFVTNGSTLTFQFILTLTHGTVKVRNSSIIWKVFYVRISTVRAINIVYYP